jgi:DNA-binding response OmpR family regulator
MGTNQIFYVCMCLLLITCSGIAVAAAPASQDYEKILHINLGYDNGAYHVLSQGVTYGKPPNLAILSGPLRGVITDGNGVELKVFLLSVPGTATGDVILRAPENGLAPYTEHQTSGELDLVLPVLPDMKQVSLYDTRTGNLLVSTDVDPAVSAFCLDYPRDPGCLARETTPTSGNSVPDLWQLLAGVFLASVLGAVSVLYLMKRARKTAPAPAPKACVLIVDDSPDIVTMVSFVLTRDGYSCLTASGGRECLDILSVQKPDVILLDVMMAPLDGWLTLEEIKKNPDTKTIPVLMLTANKLTAQEARQYHICIEDYIQKPFRDDELATAIELILARKKAFRESLSLAKKAGVDRDMVCEFATLTHRISADKKILNVLQVPSAVPVAVDMDVLDSMSVADYIRVKNRENEKRAELLRREINSIFRSKGLPEFGW